MGLNLSISPEKPDMGSKQEQLDSVYHLSSQLCRNAEFVKNITQHPLVPGSKIITHIEHSEVQNVRLKTFFNQLMTTEMVR